jgi:hypothetical protein
VIFIFQELEWPGQIHDNPEDRHRHMVDHISSAYDVMSCLEPQELEATSSVAACNNRPKVAEGKQSTQHRQQSKMASNDATKEKASDENHSLDYNSATIWSPFHSVDDGFLQDQHSPFLSDECFPADADVSDELSLASSEHLNLNEADEEELSPQENDAEKLESIELSTGGSVAKEAVACKSIHRNSCVKRSRSKPDEGQL